MPELLVRAGFLKLLICILHGCLIQLFRTRI